MRRTFTCFIFIFALFTCCLTSNIFSALSKEQFDLNTLYQEHCNTLSDINEHIPILYQLSKNCSSAVEIGVRDMVATWGLLHGLSESSSSIKSYTGIDLAYPPMKNFILAKQLSKKNGISFNFIHDNDMNIKPVQADLLFIDSLHTYRHLSYELEKFSPAIRKYIAMHDTSEPWGDFDEPSYVQSDDFEYPAFIDTTKRGLWLAVEDFLNRHPEWQLQERHLNNHGFTVLKRIE